MSIKTIIFCTLSCILLAACTNTKQQLKDKIDSKEKLLYENKNGRINTKLAREVIIHYRYYAEKFPDDSLSVEYLFKAGDVSVGIAAYDNAFEYFKIISEKYPKSNRAAYSLFLQGYISENNLEDTLNARKYYNEFLEKYPNIEMAESARFSIFNLGKSAEDVMKQIDGNKDSIPEK